MNPTHSSHQWDAVKEMMDKETIHFGDYVSHWFHKTPRRLLHSMSYYKFAAKLIGKEKRVLDIGCNEGLGTWVLATECGFAKGVDFDEKAIATAKSNWKEGPIEFSCEDVLKNSLGEWDAVVNFDVMEHIVPENVPEFLRGITRCLKQDGIAIIGTPSLEGQQYASEISKKGHVNVYSGEKLEEQMKQYFTHVFLFGANDQVIHTGFLPMAHYLICLACCKK